jgi:hypothetical protein
MDTEFIVDLQQHEFRQQDNPGNRISFNDVLPLKEAKLGLFYDPVTKNAFRGTLGEKQVRSDVTYIELPGFAVLDPEGVKERIREATEQVKRDRNKPIAMSAKEEFFLSRSKRKGRGM